MSQERIDTLVNLLRDKGEEEREQTFRVFNVTGEERTEVLRRLSEYISSAQRGLSPKELRDHKFFRQLVVQARRGKIIFFIGAGASADVGMPTTGQLRDALIAELRALGVQVSSELSFTESARLLESAVGRVRMVEILRREFDGAMRANPPPWQRGAYHLLPFIPLCNRGRPLVTTNWDDLIKRAYEGEKEEVIEVTQNSQLPLIPQAEHVVIKLHGSFENPEGMVITDRDFAITRAQIAGGTEGTLWGYVATLLAQFSFVFIGYNPQDPDFRLVRQLVESKTAATPESKPHFFVAPLSPEETDAVSRWTEMRPIPATATNFLLALFQELAEFANRLDELDMVFRRQSPPFIEFYGHFGCGKTALLDEIVRRASAEGWTPHQILRVNFDRRPDGSRCEAVKGERGIVQALNEYWQPGIPFKCIEDVGPFLRRRGEVFVILDATERVQPLQNLVLLISNVIAPVLLEMIGEGKRAKLLMAGRFPLPRLPYSYRRHLQSHALTPFAPSDVQDMARKFLLAVDPDSQEQFTPELLNDIIEISGGHARFIKMILEDLVKDERRERGLLRLPARLAEEEKRNYIRQFNKNIDEHIDFGELKEIYETGLCVFRWLNREIVRSLGLLSDPLPDLVAIRVLSPNEYCADPVIRRIKTLWLQYEYPERFAEAHRKAQEIFAKGMEQQTSGDQLGCIVEWLFHTAHLLLIEEPEETEKRYVRLLEQVRKQVRYRIYPERVRGDVRAQLVDQIEGDSELRFLLERCVGTSNMDEILKSLKQAEVQYVGTDS